MLGCRWDNLTVARNTGPLSRTAAKQKGNFLQSNHSHLPPPPVQEWPRQTKSKERPIHELFTGAFRNKSSMWIALVFLRRNTRIHKKWAKFMNFSFWPFLLVWFARATPDHWARNRTCENWPLDWTLSWALPWTPLWDVSWRVLLEAPCGWEFNRGRGRGWESRPLSRFYFALVLKGVLDTIAPLSRGRTPPKRFRRRRLRTPTTVFGCEIGRDRGLPIALPVAEGGPIAVEGVKQR